MARVLRGGAYLLLGLLVLLGLALLSTQTSAFRNWARGLAERQAVRMVNGEVRIGRLDGNLFTGAELTNVTIRQDGRDIITVERATARYDIRRLLSADLALTDVTLVRPVVVLLHDREGWRIGNLLRRRPEQPASTRTFAIESLTVVDGTVVVDDRAPEGERTPLPGRFDDLRTQLALTAGQGRIGLDFTRASFRTDAPAIDVHSLTGRLINGADGLQLDDIRLRTPRSALALDGRYQGGERPRLARTTVSASPLHIDEFATYVPALAGRALSPTFAVSLEGPLEALEVDGSLSEPTIGAVRSDVTVDARAPLRTVQGRVVVNGLNLAPLFNSPALESELTATTSVDLIIPSPASLDVLAGQVEVHSSRSELAGYRYDAIDGTVAVKGRQFTIAADARAYGASGNASGTIAARDGRVAYDLRGFIRDVDPGRVPKQFRIPRLEGDVAGAYTAVGAGNSFDGTLDFETSTVEGVTIDSGSRGRITLGGETPQYEFEGRVTDLDVRRIGRALEIPTIDNDRFVTRLTGRVVLDGSGHDLTTLRLNVSTNLEPSDVFSASLHSASIDARIEDRQLTASGLGKFASLNLSALTGRDQLEGEVAGTFDVRVTIDDLGQPITPDSMSADGSVHLEASTIGPLAFDTAVLEGQYANGGGDITSLSILGPDLTVTARGPISLTDTGDSNLTYAVVHGRLEDLSSLLGRDVAGRLRLEGTITGNRSRLASKGTALMTPLRVDTTFDALQVNSTFEASLEDLRRESLRVVADIESVLLTVAGRNLRSLTARVDYASSELQFESTAREEERSATAAGRLITRPDAREVRVEHLTLAAGEVNWSSIPGRGFTARYSHDGLLTLSDVLLTNGSQRLVAEGSVSLQPNVEGTLEVRVEHLDVAGLGALLLVQRALGGVLDGSGRLTGDSEHRTVTGQVAVKDGLVDGFKFESLDASMRTAGRRLSVEAVLHQAPGAELAISGEVAMSAEGEAANEPLDLHIRSDGIDLALLEAASTWLDNTTGRLAVNLHIGGTAGAPRMEGVVNVQDGAFTVVSTATEYTGATLDMSFEGEQLRIGALRLIDDNGEILEGSGTLRLEGRRLQDVDLTIKAAEFKVLNNELGELSVDTTLNLYGTILSPTIAGLVRVHDGRLEVDALVDRFTSNAYAVAPDEPEPDPNAPPTPPAGLAFDVTIQVPGNLVLRGRDIRPADAVVGLGDLNVTVGGDFSIRKRPGAEAVLLGTVTAVRGTYAFQGRRFELLRDGTIAFRGERPIDPALSLQAERVISGIVAHVNINGTMRSPSLTLSSRPPLDEGDILSLILFNQPINRIGDAERERLGERAVGLASGFVVSSVSDTLEHALDIDVFELEAVSDDGGGPAVTFGEQVGEHLFVRFRQIFGTQEASEFQLEYELADFLRLQGSLSEGKGRANRSLTRRVERGGIDLVLFFSY